MFTPNSLNQFPCAHAVEITDKIDMKISDTAATSNIISRIQHMPSSFGIKKRRNSNAVNVAVAPSLHNAHQIGRMP
jgi:hypothetical protein